MPCKFALFWRTAPNTLRNHTIFEGNESKFFFVFANKVFDFEKDAYVWSDLPDLSDVCPKYIEIKYHK